MRIIAHIDMDAFFAAVEEHYNPQFRGKPIVVGADPRGGKGRGVVSTCNYAARKYGIRSALPITRAWEFAEEARRKGEPATIFLSGNYRLYQEVSERIMTVLRERVDTFEQSSVDEAYLDFSSLRSFEAAEVRIRILKDIIQKTEGITCSAGIAPNKLVAKIASDFQKPNGLTIVYPDEVKGFLANLPIRRLPGIGPKTEATLVRKGVRTIKDLQEIPEPSLIEEFGKWGHSLFHHAVGISDDPVMEGGTIQSIGEQETFEKDTLDATFLLERLRVLGEEVFQRFENAGFRSFRTIVVTVRFADFTTVTRSFTAQVLMKDAGSLHIGALRLFLPFLDARENKQRRAIRLIGVRVEKLRDSGSIQSDPIT